MGECCLDRALVARFAAGGASEVEREHLEERIDSCRLCRRTIAAEAARQRPASATETLGRYELLGRIGAGGMGVVYRARDTQLARSVALKRLTRESSPNNVARMTREAQAMAQLDAPNVVRVYDAGTEDGEFFIAMELVDGVDLASWLDRPRSTSEILDVFRQAGRGLAAAHRAGIIHRDFKPQNVLVGSNGVVKVTDFGLARVVAGEAPGLLKQQITAVGSVAGTPRYMAPEQRHEAVSTLRSDVFSFCLSLAEALGCEKLEPVRLGNPSASATVERQLASLGVAREHASAIGRGVNLDPDKRFASMEELLALLEPVRPRRWWPLAAAAGAAIVAIGGVAMIASSDGEASAVAPDAAVIVERLIDAGAFDASQSSTVVRTTSKCVDLTCPKGAVQSGGRTKSCRLADKTKVGPSAFYDQGETVIRSVSFYKNNAKNGRAYRFDRNGILSSIWRYESNLRDGAQISCDPTGEVDAIRHYKDGKQDGLVVLYRVDGTPYQTYQYKQGKRVSRAGGEGAPPRPEGVCRPRKCLP